ncbi:uncharacterized protein [Miscanthus floridulus]|uniref:uncharacterized protein n=1 Tax=Miscanthus floridulus TaxID=154761 RepID=UPI00345B3582
MADGLFVAAASSMLPERKASYRPGRRFWPRVARQEASGEESGVGHDAQAPEDVALLRGQDFSVAAIAAESVAAVTGQPSGNKSLAAAARTAALDRYEADHADVHAAAIAVLNIKVLIPVILDRASNNYTRWRALFLIVLGKYALTDHVLTDVVNDDRPAWVQMNCTVLTWIYGTIHPDLQQSTMLKEPNARVAWVHLEDEFLGQRESRALLLSAEFRTVRQGSSSITDFCRKLETMAAALRDFGDPVGDRTLVLTLLRGLSEKFRPMVTNIKLRQPFPTFAEARTLLLLEEIDLNDIAGDTGGTSTTTPPPAPTALLTGSSSTAAAPHGRAPGGHPAHAGQGGGSASTQGQGHRSGRRRGRGGNKQQQSQQGQQPSSAPRPPPMLYNPWAGTVQFWPHPPPTNGAHGALYRPPPAAFTAVPQLPQGYGFGAPPGFGAGYGYGQPTHYATPPSQQQAWNPMHGGSFDTSTLSSNFSTMTLTPPGSGEWYADSGAGSHMVNNAGPSDTERDRQVQ